MYISRVEIDIENRGKTRQLSHLGAYHNWVEHCFPEEHQMNIRSRKLWRVDRLNGKNYLLMVSETSPNIDNLERYGVPNSGEIKEYNSFLQSLDEGMQLHFRVALNPVVSVSKGAGVRGRVMPHVTVEQQMQFLLDRSVKNGFQLNSEDFVIKERSYEPLKQSEPNTIRISKVVYEGILTIKDIVVFRETLQKGFGKKKAYGFGLMTVVPLRDS